MKASTKKTIKIVTPIVAVLAIIIVTLSLITVTPTKHFEGYKSLYVLNTPLDMQSDAEIGKVANKLSTSKFSIMRATLEGNLNYGIKPVKTKNSDGDTVYKTRTAKDFLILTPGLGKYMLCFDFGYGAAKTNPKFKDEKGKLIKFDRIIMVIETPNSDIQSVKLFPYIAGNLENNLENYEPNQKGEVNSAYYNVYEFTAKMYTTRLYEVLTDAGFEAGESALGSAS